MYTLKIIFNDKVYCAKYLSIREYKKLYRLFYKLY